MRFCYKRDLALLLLITIFWNHLSEACIGSVFPFQVETEVPNEVNFKHVGSGLVVNDNLEIFYDFEQNLWQRQRLVGAKVKDQMALFEKNSQGSFPVMVQDPHGPEASPPPRFLARVRGNAMHFYDAKDQEGFPAFTMTSTIDSAKCVIRTTITFFSKAGSLIDRLSLSRDTCSKSEAVNGANVNLSVVRRSKSTVVLGDGLIGCSASNKDGWELSGKHSSQFGNPDKTGSQVPAFI